MLPITRAASPARLLGFARGSLYGIFTPWCIISWSVPNSSPVTESLSLTTSSSHSDSISYPLIEQAFASLMVTPASNVASFLKRDIIRLCSHPFLVIGIFLYLLLEIYLFFFVFFF